MTPGTAACFSFDKVLGGGMDVTSNGFDIWAIDSYPSNAFTWTRNTSNQTGGSRRLSSMRSAFDR